MRCTTHCLSSGFMLPPRMPSSLLSAAATSSAGLPRILAMYAVSLSVHFSWSSTEHLISRFSEMNSLRESRSRPDW